MALGIEIVVREIRKFKRVIDDHFRIQAAVCGLIDVLEEDTVELFGNVYAPLLCVQRVLYH